MHSCPGYAEEDCPTSERVDDTRDRCPNCQRLNNRYERQRRAGMIPMRMQKIEYTLRGEDYLLAMKREEWRC